MDGNDLQKYKGEVVNRVNSYVEISKKLLSVSQKPIRILHLDDHSLFAFALKKCLLDEMPNAIITNIQNGNEALNYVLASLENNEIIDFIITDLTHPGLNGYEFTKMVRQKEKLFNKRIPIILITMGIQKPIIKNITDNGLFDSKLSKNTSCVDILKSVRALRLSF